ncbi:hypothetical protein GON26_08265 [Flavobacterium sp. GA093]|uniref:Uncharacterized protein n=1 Tax=Flavobacterium hydrocarbonoxydans TaxID=2683249 RepID=A0A6I4NTJ3_9FLAO|nr:hypothetical protein [Flavobacterium hydrocarbonoxydans]MWB94354.1 hypothetical protein [Flavobacterium hydrocarbonoxydans]
MILNTTGSANEVPADVLAEIFICRTELVENRLNGKYKNDFLTELLDFGFKNIKHQNKIANQSELEKRIDKLKK